MRVTTAFGIFNDQAQADQFEKDYGALSEFKKTGIKPSDSNSSLNVQISGDHYRYLSIQPVEYIHANKIPFIEGSVIKYVTRWREKGGIKDLEKAKHFIDLLIELELRSKNTETPAQTFSTEDKS